MKKAITFFISQAITLFGSQIVAFAIIWYITIETSSGLWVALLIVCSFVPQFLCSFIGGALADRFPRKSLIIGADAAIAIFTLALVLMMPLFPNGSSFRIALLVIAALRSAAAGIQTPSVNSAIPLIVSPEKLMRANGINSTLQSIANFAAPAAAGAVMSLSNLQWAFCIDIVTAAIGISLLCFINILSSKDENQGTRKECLFSDIVGGVSYAVKTKMVGGLLLLFGIFIFLSIPAGFLANLFVARSFGDSYSNLMLVEVVGFAGMLVGGLIMGSWGGFKDRFKTLLFSALLFGLCGVFMGLSKGFVAYLIMMLLYGIPLTAFQTATTTILQENVDTMMQGRVFGLLNSMFSGFLPIGMAVFGPMADVVSLRLLIVVSNIAIIIVCSVVIPYISKMSVSVSR
ncbi:MAG: MFS transporter [Bacteroidales bacterium]|nr:MFS transporter [Bacteroidales bacterium]